MNNELGLCPNCNTKKIIFYNGLCQTCYKKLAKEEKAKKKYKSTYSGDNKNIRIICSLFCSGKYTRKQIAEKLEISYNTVKTYTNRYCEGDVENDFEE